MFTNVYSKNHAGNKSRLKLEKFMKKVYIYDSQACQKNTLQQINTEETIKKWNLSLSPVRKTRR